MHSDNLSGERVFNLQTPSIFIDMRLPFPQPGMPDFKHYKSLEDMTTEELRLFARRHAFSGYSVVSGTPPICVRHHAIDWNFVGRPRSRPNKWRIEIHPDGDVWKEFGYSKVAIILCLLSSIK